MIELAQLFQDLHPPQKAFICLYDGQIYPPLNSLLHRTASQKVFFCRIEARKQKVLAAKTHVSYAEKELLGGTEEEWVDGNRKTFPIFALTETGLLRSPRFIKEPTRKRERGRDRDSPFLFVENNSFFFFTTRGGQSLKAQEGPHSMNNK